MVDKGSESFGSKSRDVRRTDARLLFEVAQDPSLDPSCTLAKIHDARSKVVSLRASPQLRPGVSKMATNAAKGAAKQLQSGRTSNSYLKVSN